MDVEENINKKTCSVKVQFQNLVNDAEQDDQMESHDVLRTTVADLLTRYVLWAGNLGALRTPSSKLSLDYRLSDSSDVRHEIMVQLQDIAEALADLSDVVRDTHNDRENLEQDISDEYSMILLVISGCISSLFKIGILVRKSTTRDRFERALQESDLEFPPRFDIQHVHEKHPKTSLRGLAVRLGSAITKRRQFIMYCRDHRLRLGEESALEDKKTAHEERSSSKATTFIPNEELADIQMEEDDVASFASASTITDSDHALQLPSLASLSPDGQPFECPICFTLQTFQRDKSWRRHAYRDLKAYVCTLGDSKCDDLLFQDRESWFNHEMKTHRATYTCPLCDRAKAVSKTDLQAHLTVHGSFDSHQLEALAEGGLDRANKIPASDCPFCQGWAEQLQSRSLCRNLDERSPLVSLSRFRRHVATHQEQLALFALPQSNKEDEIEDGIEDEVENQDTVHHSSSESNSQMYSIDLQGHIAEVERVLKSEEIDIEQLGEAVSAS
ncbi:Ff.00g053980.m01.CDS01 [Fusarium sp. VM40]|nr:Ff.00g053980.m01.CDS01 [Fusarium sp. VM40]